MSQPPIIPNAPDVPGVVLAGGQGKRMGGQDKAFCRLEGRPLLAHVLDRIGPQCRAMAISANGDPARFAAFGLPVLPDPVPGFPGPLAGVLAAMEWAAGQGAEAVVTVAVDTPFLPDDLVARLAAGGAGVAVAASPDADGVIRRHPTAALWPVDLRVPLCAWLAAGERRLGGFARMQGARDVVFAQTPDPFANINAPDDLIAAAARPPV